MISSAGRRTATLVAGRPGRCACVAATPYAVTPGTGPWPGMTVAPGPSAVPIGLDPMPPIISVDRAASGWVVRVDLPNRELTILADGRALVLDVPPGCAVLMNGQPVRLRLLQSEDRVRVRYEPG